MNITFIQANGKGWFNGEYLYEVSAKLDGKRETLKVGNLDQCLAFHIKVNAYVDGKYDNEVFAIINAIAQGRAEERSKDHE